MYRILSNIILVIALNQFLFEAVLVFQNIIILYFKKSILKKINFTLPFTHFCFLIFSSIPIKLHPFLAKIIPLSPITDTL